MTVRVAINGYGTIGKRVADAVSAQNDMAVVGVSKTRPTYEAFLAAKKGYPLYVPSKDHVLLFEDNGLKVEGTIEEMLEACDVVVDCLPGKKGVEMLPLYKDKKRKAVFQGGEKHTVAGTSFSAVANYRAALGKDYVRVVSCNTTGLVRTLHPLREAFGIKKVYATMVRRAVDPRDDKKGPVNAITPVLKVPSHHGPDVQTVMEGLDISTMAVAVPTTLMHVHCNTVILEKEVSAEDVISVWEKSPRVRLVNSKHGLGSTATLMEYARDLIFPRSDMMDIVVWRDGAHTDGSTLYYYQAIHQESDVVPENVDCIRAMMELEEDPVRSIEKTDRSLKEAKWSF